MKSLEGWNMSRPRPKFKKGQLVRLEYKPRLLWKVINVEWDDLWWVYEIECKSHVSRFVIEDYLSRP